MFPILTEMVAKEQYKDRLREAETNHHHKISPSNTSLKLELSGVLIGVAGIVLVLALLVL